GRRPGDRPPLRSRHAQNRYRRRSCCPPRSIITAATPRQTAAPHASVNSEIHMASSPMLQSLSSHHPTQKPHIRSRNFAPKEVIKHHFRKKTCFPCPKFHRSLSSRVAS